MTEQNFKRQVCPICNGNKFYIDTGRDTDFDKHVNEITDIENNLIDYYTVKFVCSNSNCDFEHEIPMGSD